MFTARYGLGLHLNLWLISVYPYFPTRSLHVNPNSHYAQSSYIVCFSTSYQILRFASVINTKSIYRCSFPNFRRVLNAVLCLLGNLRASELLVPTFRNLLAVPSS